MCCKNDSPAFAKITHKALFQYIACNAGIHCAENIVYHQRMGTRVQCFGKNDTKALPSAESDALRAYLCHLSLTENAQIIIQSRGSYDLFIT